MKCISVICAVPPGLNPGMASVDMGCHAFLARAGINVEVHFYHFISLEERLAHKKIYDKKDRLAQMRLPITYEVMHNNLDKIYASDAILFWGDFLHDALYHKRMAKMVWQLDMAKTIKEAGDVVNQYLFLSEAPKGVLSKTFAFGETIIFNRATDYTNVKYIENMKKFFGGIHSVWMRDVYSALKVSQLRNDYSSSHLGVDCSMLVDEKDFEKIMLDSRNISSENRGEQIGVFFGRTSEGFEILGKFMKEFWRASLMPMVWIPWGDDTAFKTQNMSKIMRKLKHLKWVDYKALPNIADIYLQLKECTLVISDTYHVCLNAWRMGIPAICIGEALPTGERNWNSGYEYAWRDKRRTFYSMYDAMEFYVCKEELSSRVGRRRRVEQLISLIKKNDAITTIKSSIGQHRDHVEQQLGKSLSDVLSKS